jgi:SAM-dependent methyltransferase
LPSEDELARYYAQEEGWEGRIPHSEAGIQKRLQVKRARYALHLAALEGLVDGRHGDGQPKALDFGCGLGAWLDVLKARGWQTYGLEPGPRAAEIAGREHTILTAIPTAATFDLIIVNHVFEHLRDPLGVARALAAATKNSGHLYVSVPDLSGLAVHHSLSYVANERHIFSYTSSSLRSLFALSGFELIAHSNEAVWPGEPIDKDDAKRLKAVGVPVEGELPLAPDPLAEAIASMVGYEPHAAKRLLGVPAEQAHRKKTRAPAKRSPVQPRRSRHGRVVKRIRRFFLVRLRAAVRMRLERLRSLVTLVPWVCLSYPQLSWL